MQHVLNVVDSSFWALFASWIWMTWFDFFLHFSAVLVAVGFFHDQVAHI